MKKFVILLLACSLITGLTFVSCNSEVSTPTVSVSFAPATTKAINQSGTVQSTDDENVSLYHWEYAYVQGNKIEVSDSLAWTEFYTDKSKTGLGNINGLVKNSTYSFALRGYTTGTDGVLMWEGATESGTLLSSKKTVITIKVNPKGKGMIYFDIDAPVFSTEITTSGTGYTSENNDKFKISWVKLGDTTVKGEIFKEGSLNTDGDAFEYNTVGKEALMLDSGSYLFTIQQYEYNEYSSDTDYYDAVTSRKQVLIVDAMSGMDTVLSGSLDSEALTTFNYDAGAAGDEYGIEVEWADIDTSDITTLKVTAETGDSDEKRIYPYQTVKVKNGSYIFLKTSTTDAIEVYVNGDKVNITTDTDTYVTDTDLSMRFYSKDNDKTDPESFECSYLKSYNVVSGKKTIMAYGKKDLDYLVTIVSGNKSLTFTVQGEDEDFVDTFACQFQRYNYSDDSIPDVSIYLPKTMVDSWGNLFDAKVGNKEVTAKVNKRVISDTDYTVVTFSDSNDFKDEYLVCSVNSLDNKVPAYEYSAWEQQMVATEYQKDGWKLMPINKNGLIQFDKKSIGVKLNSTVQMSVKVSTNSADYLAKHQPIIWSSSDPSIASVDSNGLVTGHKLGKAVISATSSLTGQTISVDPFYCYDGDNYIKFTSNNGNNIKITLSWVPSNSYFEYSLDGNTWSPFTSYSGQGTVVYMRGYNETLKSDKGYAASDYEEQFRIFVTDSAKCEGDIRSILNFVDPESVELNSNITFSGLFRSSSITTAPDLPFTKLTQSCYINMFFGCQSLQKAPELPATTLAPNCYQNMFKYCTALKETPDLPATTLADQCYDAMFEHCTSLTTATDILPATEVPFMAYRQMFYECTSLKAAPRLAVTTFTGKWALYQMFLDCSSLQITQQSENTGNNGLVFDFANVEYSPGVDKEYMVRNMFLGTAGSFKGTPSEGKYYYGVERSINE